MRPHLHAKSDSFSLQRHPSAGHLDVFAEAGEAGEADEADEADEMLEIIVRRQVAILSWDEAILQLLDA